MMISEEIDWPCLYLAMLLMVSSYAFTMIHGSIHCLTINDNWKKFPYGNLDIILNQCQWNSNLLGSTAKAEYKDKNKHKVI